MFVHACVSACVCVPACVCVWLFMLKESKPWLGSTLVSKTFVNGNFDLSYSEEGEGFFPYLGSS